jgi:SAM-dependent methyltransferase
MDNKDHWDRVYTAKAVDSVSWFREHLDESLRLIAGTGVPLSASIIDVGGGASTLVVDLLARRYSGLTVLDVSHAALVAAQARLGPLARRVHWLEADITHVALPANAYDVWHDRAVFHFLTAPEQRAAYVRTVMQAVRPGGHVIVATFAEDGPTKCSGLPVVRYAPEQLQAEFGSALELMEHTAEDHRTPAGAVQKFVYCRWRKRQP